MEFENPEISDLATRVEMIERPFGHIIYIYIYLLYIYIYP